MTNQHFAHYKVLNIFVTKDGHTMTNFDIAKELNRKSFLEENKLELERQISANQSFESKINIIKLADFIAEEEATGRYLTNKEALAVLNTMVGCHAMVIGTEPMYYTQNKPEVAKDYVA